MFNNVDWASVSYAFINGLDKSISWEIIHLSFLIFYNSKPYFVTKLYNNLITIQCGTAELSIAIQSLFLYFLNIKNSYKC